jgi:hypothetical protein
MIWEEIVEFKHCFIYRNDEPLELMKYHDEGVDEEHTKGHHTG